MFKKLIVGATAALILSVSGAAAATLNFVGTGQSHLVTRNDVISSLNHTHVDTITGDQKTNHNGLFLDLAAGGSAEVTYTFMGAEAGNSNFSASMGNALFFNRGRNISAVGDQFTTIQNGSGLLDFAFGTYAPLRAIGFFMNNGFAYPGSSNFAMGFVQIDINSFYVLFDDIARGDRDFDDLVMRIDVAAVPLPAGGMLLLSGLAGAFMMRRRRSIA